jgi:phage gp36-like protein
MTYTVLTRTIDGITNGALSSDDIGLALVFVMSTGSYTAVVESVNIATTTSVVLVASASLPASGGTVSTVTMEAVITTTGLYCTQGDLESRIGVLQLAQLTNDNANPTTSDTTIVTAIITKACTEIDAKAGQVYTVPFVAPTNCVSIPKIIKELSIDMSVYYCFARRFSEAGVPKVWADLYTTATKVDGKLDDISNLLVQLDGSPTLLSGEADMQASNTTRIDFSNTDNMESFY